MNTRPIDITDEHDERLADYRSLTDIAERRRIEGDEFFICEGPVALERLMTSGHMLRSVLTLRDKFDRVDALLHANAIEIDAFTVSREVMTSITGFDLHRGIIASANRRRPLDRDAVSTVLEASRRVAVLEGLNDPENLGAIARSAHALGIDALFIDPTCIDPYTRRTVRVSMGEILHLPTIRYTNTDELANMLDGWELWALTPDPHASDIWTLGVPERVALMFGAEGPGLSRQALTCAHRAVRIPLNPNVDSLNVGNAAAVAFAILGRPFTSE